MLWKSYVELISGVTLQLGKRPRMTSLERKALKVGYLQSQRRAERGHRDTPTMKILRKPFDSSLEEIILSLVRCSRFSTIKGP